MANPSEYHTMLYELFFNGNVPAERTGEDGKEGEAVLTPQNKLDGLLAIREQARKLREAELDG